MPRIYLPATPFVNNQISITGEKAHYLASVLRCREGDNLIIFDGEGECFKTTIIRINRKEVITEVIEKFSCNLESHLNITLVQSLLKGEKMDMVIQKATELGVKEIYPVITERSQLRETKKIARWRKIAGEASRQSGRSIVPVIHEPVEFMNFLKSQRSEIRGHGVIFYEEEGISLREAMNRIQDIENHASCIMHHVSRSIYIFIGPEGGFTKEEVNSAEENGFLVTSLGKRILRAETAAISAVTLVQFLLGELA